MHRRVQWLAYYLEFTEQYLSSFLVRLTFLSCIFFMATLVPWQVLDKVSTLAQPHLVVASLHVHLSGHRVEGVSGEVQETGDSREV